MKLIYLIILAGMLYGQSDQKAFMAGTLAAIKLKPAAVISGDTIKISLESLGRLLLEYDKYKNGGSKYVCEEKEKGKVTRTYLRKTSKGGSPKNRVFKKQETQKQRG